MTENEKDIALLQSDPRALIVKYQPTIRTIAGRFVRAGLSNPSDLDDIVQTVNEALLARAPSIQRRYNGRSTVATYLSAVIRNLCLDFRQESKSRPQPVDSLDPADPHPASGLDAVAIGQAAKALQEVIDLVPAERPRLLVLLPLHFKVPLDKHAILSAYPHCRFSWIREILQALGGNISLLNEHDIYSLITPFLNEMEGRLTSADGYRHWVSERIPDIIELLNARLSGARFDKETLQILVEKTSVQNSS